MASGFLCSDHVNYLILRYLQETGHEKAATAFYTDWRRGSDFRDPENYPFARVVRRNELVRIIQSGLHHDELEAQVKRGGRRYQFTDLSSRESLERQDGAVLENGTAASRPSSSAKRKSRPVTLRPPVDFPTPAPKRQRRSGDIDSVHLNGDRDAMDVDAASVSPDADEDGEGASPAMVSEPDMVEVPERYDSMDVAVQTEVKVGPKTSTMYWKIDKYGAAITHSMFNPAANSKNANTLLTVGESLCRFYVVPDDMVDGTQILGIDDPLLPPWNSAVTATAWHPRGRTAICAVDCFRELPDGRQLPNEIIFTHNCDTDTSTEFFVPSLMEPAGIVLALRYNSNGEYLLVARTNLTRGLVLVYDDTSPSNGYRREPIAWSIFDYPVLDVIWSAFPYFMVCGENGVAEICRVDRKSGISDEDSTGGMVTTSGLERSAIRMDEPARRWDKIRYDERTNILALASSEERRLAIGEQRFYHNPLEDVRILYAAHLPGTLTAIAFQPAPSSEPNEPALLTVTFEEGSCVIYSCSPNSFSEVLTLHLKAGPGLALAWSQDGAYLAVGGTDLVQIWQTDELIEKDTKPGAVIAKTRNGLLNEPLVTWRPDANAVGPRNGELEDERPLSEPSLSWSADGESLAFAIDKEIAIIRFRPPLRSNEREEVNGHASP